MSRTEFCHSPHCHADTCRCAERKSPTIKPGDLIEIQWHHYDAFRGWVSTPTRALVERVDMTRDGTVYGAAATFGPDGEESCGCDFYRRVDGRWHHGGMW